MSCHIQSKGISFCNLIFSPDELIGMTERKIRSSCSFGHRYEAEVLKTYLESIGYKDVVIVEGPCQQRIFAED